MIRLVHEFYDNYCTSSSSEDEQQKKKTHVCGDDEVLTKNTGGGDGTKNNSFSSSSSCFNTNLNNLLRERKIRIKQVVCGQNKIVFFLTEDSSVYVLGRNTGVSSGCCLSETVPSDCFDGAYLKEPYQLIEGREIPIQQIIPAHSHTMFLSSDNFVYGWGSNERFQMYFPRERKLTKVTKLSIPKVKNSKFKLVSGGCDFSIYLSMDNVLYSSGANASGQCGVASKKDQIMAIVDYVSQIHSIDPSVPNCDIIELQSTFNSTLFRTSDCKLYGFGYKAYGTLGCSEETEDYQICRVGSGSKEFINEKCISYSCGLFFVSAITESNQLYVFGYNNFNQLSVKDDCVRIPVKINFPPSSINGGGVGVGSSIGNAQQVVCGGYHTVALTTENKLFVTGHYKVRSSLTEFTEMCEYGKGTQIQLSAGDYHTAILIKIDYISQHFPRMGILLSMRSHLSDISFHFVN